jgi:hypothetical protein
VSIGFAAVIVLILLVLLLPNLLSTYTNNQGHTGTQAVTTPTTAAPTSTSTTVTNVCPDQSQVTINDTANVLDTTQICSAVSQWPYTLTIYTTNTSSQDGNISNTAQSLLTNANTVVMAIGIDNSHDHPRPHISIIGGESVQISNTLYHRAEEAFTRKANTGDYTNATIAAIQVLQAGDQNGGN